MIEIGINSEILKVILDGRKTIEGRLAKDKFLAIKSEDVISIREDFYQDRGIVRSVPDSVRFVADDVRKYRSFREMLESVGYTKVIPDAANIDEATKLYATYYSEEDERAFGVLGIFIRDVEPLTSM